MPRNLRVGETTLGLAGGGYHYTLCPRLTKGGGSNGADFAATEFALISSDDLIRTLCVQLNGDQSNNVLGKHEGVCCIAAFPGAIGDGWITGSRDGTVRQWDARSSGKSATWQHSQARKAPYLSVASDSNGYLWASGTELTSSIAEVEVWDMRKMAAPMISYVECHNDDVSVLTFSTTRSDPATLLSGSTDGLVNVYSPSWPAEEDDALLQVINHGSSIHRAGFLPRHHVDSTITESTIYALSHDETLSFYKRERDAASFDDAAIDAMETDPDDASSQEERDSIAYGDVRSQFNCEYVIDIIDSEATPSVVVGNHNDRELRIYPLIEQATKPVPHRWALPHVDSFSTKLTDVHGGEIVRTVAWCGSNSMLLSAGEDGRLAMWRVDSEESRQKLHYAATREEEEGEEDANRAKDGKSGVERGKHKKKTAYKPY